MTSGATALTPASPAVAGPRACPAMLMDYHRFAILDGVDGRTTPDPPSLTREHLYNTRPP